jgi:hypothetical protein
MSGTYDGRAIGELEVRVIDGEVQVLDASGRVVSDMWGATEWEIWLGERLARAIRTTPVRPPASPSQHTPASDGSTEEL